jgi:hypothetical protein
VVARVTPFTWTTEEAVKLVPVTPTDRAPEPASALDGESMVSVVFDGMRAMAQLAGAWSRAGRNGGCTEAKPYSAAALLVGLFAMSSSAVAMFVGAVPPGGVASTNRLPQMESSPATPPALFTHAEMTSESVLISVVGTVDPEGTEVPGDDPLAMLANSAASVKALANALASDNPEPILNGEVM